MSRLFFASGFESRLKFTALFSLAVLLSAGTAFSQSRSLTDGYTPTGLQQGAPAGSYSLGGFDNINMFNGHLSFTLPLISIGGRGTAGHAVVLPIIRGWGVTQVSVTEMGEVKGAVPRDGTVPWYGPGFVTGVRAASEFDSQLSCGSQLYPVDLLTRVKFTAPDGTEIMLHDEKYQGARKFTERCTNNPPPVNRERVFRSSDGGSMTFVSDNDIIDDWHIIYHEFISVSGYLLMADGTRYRIDNNRVSWIRDRNGNKVSFTYEPNTSRVTTITDSLNRRVNITYATTSNSYDAITFKGFGNADRTIKVWFSSMEQALRPDFTIKTGEQLFPEIYNFNPIPFPGNWTHNPTVVSSVEMPDGRSYKLYYNSYGELARVILPTGGGYDYDYTPSGTLIPGTSTQGSVIGMMVHRPLTKKTIYETLDSTTHPSNPPAGTVEKKEIFIASSLIVSGSVDTVATVEHRDSGDVLQAQEKHYFFGQPTFQAFGSLDSTSYSPWTHGREYKTESFNVSGGGVGSVLRRVEHAWFPDPRGTYCDCPAPDPRIIETVTTLADTNQVSKRTFAHDQYNNVTDVWEYDFGAGAPGPLIRRTHTPYLTTNGNQGGVNYATNPNIHIRNLPVQKLVYDASENLRSQTDFFYDNYSGLPLVECPGIVQHDDGFHPGFGARGNLTGVILRNPGGSPSEIHLHNQYDIAGNLVKAIDGRTPAGITTFDFGDRFGSPDDDAQSNAGAPELAGGFSYAFPTKVTNTLDHTAYIQYDYYLGRPVNSEDANGVVGSVTYNDVLDRTTHGIQARYKVGVGIPAERRQTTIAYDDANRVITTTSDRDLFGDKVLTGKSYYDGLGRTRRSAAREGATWSITDTRFDALGRVSQVSNPYRAADPDTASPPSGAFAEWATTDYDVLGRVIKATTPDGAHVDTAYSGKRVTVTDQAGKKRSSETDALGRLIKITEAPGELNYETYYSYDALGNLLQVTQGTQTRTFVYDSLSRLTSATNPESGPISYVYDPNGNLVEKTDARGVKTTMIYDALNRVKSKVYAGTPQGGTEVANATPPVTYFYDDYSTLPGGGPTWPTWSCGGQTLPNTPVKGKLIGVTYGTGSEGTYYRYDATGKIIGNLQRMGTPNFVTRYTHNLAGAVLEECRGYSSSTKASVRNMSAYDDAGRLIDMRTSFTPHTSSKYLVQGISYTPFGALQTEKYGNGLIHSIGYNNRLQPTEIRLGRPDNLESVFTIYNLYGTAANPTVQDPEITLAQNNGNIARIKYVISGALQYSQTFQYDPLNRLKYAVEHKNGAYNDAERAWYQTFEYDFAGNRGVDTLNTSDNVDGENSALRRAEFSGANNRITRLGYSYDAVGNFTEEPGKRYTYDAENRLVTAEMVGGATSQYAYDGNGKRVKKTVSGVGTRFEYGVGGELIAERNDAGVVTTWYYYRNGELLATSVNGTTHKYAASDHLGSPRAWTDDSGNLVAGGRHDYLPFGEELFAGVGNRETDQGYATNTQQDGQRKQFTSKERDSETGLDYFLARYYSSIQGRFTSPDEFTGGPDELFAFAEAASANPTFYADLTNPQSLNKYQYTYNNPLSYTDPDGHCPVCPAYYYENYVKPKIQEFDRTVTQIKNDFVDYGKGIAKSVANTVIDINNYGNVGRDELGNVVPLYERYEPANESQAIGMGSGDKLMLLSGGAAKGAPVNVAMAEGKLAATVAPKLGSAGGPGAGKPFTQKTKSLARKESNNTCVFCGVKTNTTTGPRPTRSRIDHAIPKSQGGNNTLGNAQNTCQRCNVDKGTLTTEEYLKKRGQP